MLLTVNVVCLRCASRELLLNNKLEGHIKLFGGAGDNWEMMLFHVYQHFSPSKLKDSINKFCLQFNRDVNTN